MAFDLSFRNVKSIKADACEPPPEFDLLGKSIWVDLSINTTDGQRFVMTCFFHGEDKIGLAKAYADAINAVSLNTADPPQGDAV